MARDDKLEREAIEALGITDDSLCAHCGARFERDLSLAGKSIKCPRCKQPFVNPVPTAVPASPAHAFPPSAAHFNQQVYLPPPPSASTSVQTRIVMVALGSMGVLVVLCCGAPCLLGLMLPSRPSPTPEQVARITKANAAAAAKAEADRNAIDAAAKARGAKAEELLEKVDAWTMAEEFVRNRLKSPSTASFGSLLRGTYQDPEDCVTAVGNGRYRVVGWVDSQNSFGATLRADFVVTVQNNGDDSWSLVHEPLIMTR